MELSSRVGLAPATTCERVKRLEETGVIVKYVALINPEKVNKNVTAFVELNLKDHSREIVKQLEFDIDKIPEVLECYHIAGDKDFLLKVITADIKGYETFALEKLATLPYIKHISTMFVLSTVKNQTRLPIE
jgi:DNA-binding Lrp family transcriptional regulator